MYNTRFIVVPMIFISHWIDTYFRHPTKQICANICANHTFRYSSETFQILHTQSLVEDMVFNVVTENANTAYTMLLGLKYVIVRCFKLGSDNQLKLLSANVNGSRIATQLHLYRIMVCSKLTNNYTSKWESIISLATSRPLIHHLCPLIRNLKQLDSLKPKQVQKKIDPCTHDITVDKFIFKKENYSKLIPQTFSMFEKVFGEILDGDSWREVLDCTNDINLQMSGSNFQRPISFSLFFGDSNATTNSCSVVTEKDIKLCTKATEFDFQHMDCLMQLTLHGLGGGPMRVSEFATLTLNRVTYCGDCVKFFGHSFKQMNTKTINRKLIERRLHISLSRCAILYNIISRMRCDINQPVRNFCMTKEDYVVESPPMITMTEVFANIMKIENFDSLNSRMIRSMYTSIQNIIGIGQSNTPFQVKASASEELASRAGHTKFTHDMNYASEVRGEELFQLYFNALGGQNYALSSFSEDRIKVEPDVPDTLILECMRKLYGTDTSFFSIEQERAIKHCCNNDIRTHAFFTISCGGGKSASWEISTLARYLNKNTHQTQIVTVPYCFLLNSQYMKSYNMLEEFGIKIKYYTWRDINCDRVPDEFAQATNDNDVSSLPHLIFVSLEALHSLFTYHHSIIDNWKDQNLLRCIYIDEIHTIFTEITFRSCYAVYQKLATLGIPLIALSGTLDNKFFGSLSRYLHFKEDEQSFVSSIMTVDDGIVFSRNIKISCFVTSNYILDACTSIDKYLIKNSKKKAHVIVSTVEEGHMIYKRLKNLFYVVEFIYSGSGNQEECASRWVSGSIGVLISTTIGIVGNENKDNHFVCIVGYLYNCQSIVQSIGRIRPHRRKRDLSQVQVYVDNLSEFEKNRMIEASNRMTSNMIRHNLVDEQYKEHFFNGSTQFSVYAWIRTTNKCRIASLGERVGSHVERKVKCNQCDVCNMTLNQNQINSMSKVANDFCAKQKNLINRTIENLRVLRRKCLLCNNRSCKGTCKQVHGRCLKCDGRHKSSECKKEYLPALAGKACFACYEYVWDNNKIHDFRQCQIYERLRILFIMGYRQETVTKRTLTYLDYLNKHFVSKTSYCMFVNTHFDDNSDR